MNFSLRKMQESDIDVTFKWRNDPEVLRNAMTPHVISISEHIAMFKWNNSLRLIFDVDAVPVGFVSVSRDPEGPRGEWAFHMAPEFRGKGLSTIMLNATLYYLKTKEGYEEITSIVLDHNVISHHLHEKLGFESTGGKGTYHEYTLVL